MRIFSKDIKLTNEKIDSANYISIIIHNNPDGDAVGAAVAMYKYLTNYRKKKVSIVLPNHPSQSISFVLPEDYTIAETDFKKAHEILIKTDLLLVLDMNLLNRAGENIEKIFESENKLPYSTILIDHHVKPERFDVMFSYPESSSTCEIVYNVLTRLTGYKVFDKEISTALYLGIITDTGSLSYSCNDPALYVTISYLLKSGIIANKINQKIFNTYSHNRLNLLGYSISRKMMYFPKQRAAFIYLSKEELNRFKYVAGDLEGVVNYPLKMADVDFSALLSEQDNKIRMSFRSKDESVDVNRFARAFWNGGGHIMASGGKSFLPLDEVVKQLKKQILSEKFRL